MSRRSVILAYFRTPRTLPTGNPHQRLVESPDIEEGYKAELRRRAALYNPVKLKGLVDQEVTEFLRINRQKGDTAFG
jgi:hypothetical protein